MTPHASPNRRQGDGAAAPTPLRVYLNLFRIPSFSLVTLSGAALTFCLGGFAVWMPSFFHRAWGLSVAQAGTLVGGVTVVSGIFGSMAGGWLADRLLPRTSKAYFWVSGAGFVLGLPLVVLCMETTDLHLSVAALLAAEFFLFLNWGPLNAAIVAVTDVSRRSMAFAANILVIHALGDAVSPAIIGTLSDRFGLKAALIASSVGIVLAAVFCFWAMKYYDRDALYA